VSVALAAVVRTTAPPGVALHEARETAGMQHWGPPSDEPGPAGWPGPAERPAGTDGSGSPGTPDRVDGAVPPGTGSAGTDGPGSQGEPERGPRKPRLGWFAAGLAATAGVVAWIVLTGPEPSPDDAAPTPARPAAEEDGTANEEGTASATAAGSRQAPHAAFTVTPAAGLADKAEVRIAVPTPYLTQDRPAVALCAAGTTFACTDVATSDLAIQATENSVTAVLPRRFTTRIGDIHDCVDDSPCELRLWVFDFRIEERNLSLDFADSPAAPGLLIETQTDSDGRLTLHLPDRSYEPLQCLTGLDRACTPLRTLPADNEAAGPSTDAADSDDRTGLVDTAAGDSDDAVAEPDPAEGLAAGTSSRPWRVAVEPADLVVTPRGPYSCAEEGPCEIRFLTPDGRFAEPLPIAPSQPRAEANAAEPTVGRPEEDPLLAVRPSHGLLHGQEAQIHISNTTDTRAPLWLCAPKHRLCADLEVIATGQPGLLRLPRVIADRHKATAAPVSSIDCAAAACELRAVVGGRLVRESLTFDAGLPAPAAPELAVAETGPFRDGGLVAVRGRGFFGPVDPGDDRVSTTIRLCETPDAAPYECTSVLESQQGISPDGSLDTVIRIPPSSAWRQTFDLDGSQRLACEDACWLVVEQALETPSAALPIELARSDNPRLP